MRLLISLVLSALSLAASAASAIAWPSPHTLGPYAYLSPAPGSGLHLPTTNIIVRAGGAIDPATVHDGII